MSLRNLQRLVLYNFSYKSLFRSYSICSVLSNGNLNCINVKLQNFEPVACFDSLRLFSHQRVKGGVCLSKTFCTSNNMSVVTYDEVKDLPNHPEKYLIDVREPNELQQTGQIPTSINIPVGQVEEAFKLDDDSFKTKYGRDLPSKSTEIIFSCKLGGRAARAADSVKNLGFTNTKVYKGSWTDWADKEGLPK